MALARRGHRVTVFTGTDDAYPPCDGVRVRRHRMLDLSVEHAGGDSTAGELRSWFRRELSLSGQIRLVHGHNLHHFSSAPARALKSLQRELKLVLPHTYHSIWRTAKGERTARDCAIWDAHYAVSDFLVRECTEVLGISVFRTYLGVDTSAYLQVPKLAEIGPRPNLLLPARLIPDKDATVAVKAFDRIIARSVGPRPRLVLTDPADTVDFHSERNGFRTELADLISECGLSRGRGPEVDVEFRPAQLEEMVRLYSEATVVIYPSRFGEPMGLAPLDAMCAARPVVATKVGGLIEGGSEFLVPDETEDKVADGLAEKVLRLLEDPGHARRAGVAAREHVLAEFDLERVYVDPMLAEYERLLAMWPMALAV